MVSEKSEAEEIEIDYLKSEIRQMLQWIQDGLEHVCDDPKCESQKKYLIDGIMAFKTVRIL